LEFKPAAAAPADVLAQSAGAMTLKVGPRPTDRPLVLRTPHGEIRVTGTRFVSLVGPKATRVEIDEGHVRVTRFSDGRSIAIREGDYAVIGSGTEPLAPRSAPITLTEAAHMLDGGPDQYLVDLAITADGSTMIAGHAAGSVAFWDLAAGRVRRVIETRMKDLRCLALSPDGRRLALGTLRGQMRLWDVATGEPAAPAADPSNHLAALTFCDGGALVAATGRVREARGLRSVVRLWRTESGRREADLPCGDAVLRSLAASPDGGLLAAGDEQGVMTLWDARQRGPLHRFQAHDDTVSSIAFSPDGRWLATGGHDGTIRLWDPATRDARATLKGHAARVLALAFCPDRMLLASADQYGIARLWDLRTAREVVGFVRVKWRESRIAFLPDGRVLVTAAGTDKIRLWDVPQEVLESSATWGGR
jgi:WD40 repeat protein